MGEHNVAVKLVAMCVAGVSQDSIGDCFLVFPSERLTAAWAELLIGHTAMLRLAPAAGARGPSASGITREGCSRPGTHPSESRTRAGHRVHPQVRGRLLRGCRTPRPWCS